MNEMSQPETLDSALRAAEPVLRRMLERIEPDAAAAADLLQDTLLVAITNPPPSDVPLHAWLFGVARNLQYRRHRSTVRREARELRAEAGSLEVGEPVDTEAVRRRVRDVIDHLSEPYRTTLWMRYYDEMSAAEIARRLGVPAGTVRKRTKVALDRLRAKIDGMDSRERERWRDFLMRAWLPAMGLRGRPGLRRWGWIFGLVGLTGLLIVLPWTLGLGQPGSGRTFRTGTSASLPPHVPAFMGAAAGDLEANGAESAPTEVAETPAKEAAFVPDCALGLQALIDRAAAGTRVAVPPCVFRESVVIDKPLVLDGGGRAEIRGSDVWEHFDPVTGPGGEPLRVSQRILPRVYRSHDGTCPSPSGEGCKRLLQVFADGHPQRQVQRVPAPGEYMLRDDDRLLLPADTAGQVIEVSVRQRWVLLGANDVHIEGFGMRHLINPARVWGIETRSGHSRGVRLRSSELAQTTGPVVAFEGSEHEISGNTIHDSGGTAILLRGGRFHLVADNVLIGNNWFLRRRQTWSPAGVMVLDGQASLLRNRIEESEGPAIFCVSCERSEIVQNVLSANWSGVVALNASETRVDRNEILGKGGRSSEAGAGIAVLSSFATEVTRNRLRENARSIFVASRDESCRWRGQNRIADNVIEPFEAAVDFSRGPWSWRASCPGDREERNALVEPAPAVDGR